MTATRRDTLLTAGASLLLPLPLPLAAAADPTTCTPEASSATAGLLMTPSVRNPGAAWAITNTQRTLFYPDWLEGEWEWSNAQLVSVSNPLGERFVTRNTPGVTKNSMILGFPDVGASLNTGRPVTFRQRQVRDAAQGGIVQDRPFNIAQKMQGYLGYLAVERVEYEPVKNPTRVSVLYTTPRRDGTSNDRRKAELFLNARTGECVASATPGREVYVTTENIRQVNQAKNDGFVYDYLVITRYSRAAGSDALDISQRVAAFVMPQEPLYFEALDKAVALYDYTFQARRVG
jgi:hypothetical protein